MIPNRIPDDISEDVIAMHGAIVGSVRPFRGKTKKPKNYNSIDVRPAHYDAWSKLFSDE
jgi:hypothetical protein